MINMENPATSGAYTESLIKSEDTPYTPSTQLPSRNATLDDASDWHNQLHQTFYRDDQQNLSAEIARMRNVLLDNIQGSNSDLVSVPAADLTDLVRYISQSLSAEKERSNRELESRHAEIRELLVAQNSLCEYITKCGLAVEEREELKRQLAEANNQKTNLVDLVNRWAESFRHLRSQSDKTIAEKNSIIDGLRAYATSCGFNLPYTALESLAQQRR